MKHKGSIALARIILVIPTFLLTSCIYVVQKKPSAFESSCTPFTPLQKALLALFVVAGLAVQLFIITSSWNKPKH